MKVKLALFLILCASLVRAQSDLIDQSYQNSQDLECYIEAYQQTYTVGKPVLIRISLRNTGSEPVEITQFPDPWFSFRFHIFDSDRTMLSMLPGLNTRDENVHKSELLYRRTILLYPGEEVSQKIDLNNWYSFSNMGRHIIQCVFRDQDHDRELTSNPLFLQFKPGERIIAALRLEEEIRTREQNKTYTPEGTVEYILKSFHEKDWESAFRYIDFNTFIETSFQPWDDLFREARDPERKDLVITRFQEWFKESEAVRVAGYKIQNIVFPERSDERVIHCYVQLEPGVVPNTYLNTYYLRQKGNKWYLRKYESWVTKKQDFEHYDYTDTVVLEKENAERRLPR